MGRVVLDISMSLDGCIAGPNATLDEPLGRGGERLHEWAYGLETWRASHGLEGGERSRDSELLDEILEGAGAAIVGRRMFSGGEGPWEDDPNADAWWGDEPPFHRPVFVVTHHAREPVEKRGGTTFTFVTDGIESALEQARAAASDKDVTVGGGADVARQYLKAQLLDELRIHLVPVLLGDGVRLFDGVSAKDAELEVVEVIESPRVTHLRYRVVK